MAGAWCGLRSVWPRCVGVGVGVGIGDLVRTYVNKEYVVSVRMRAEFCWSDAIRRSE